MHTYKWEELDHHVSDIEKTAGKLQDKIHAVAMAAFYKLRTEPEFGGDVARIITRLANASPYHGRAFATWVNDQSNLAWSDENKSFYVPANEEGTPTLLTPEQFVTMRDQPFYKYKPAQQVKPITDLEEVEKLLQRLKKRQQEPKDGDAFAPGLLADLENIVHKCKVRIEEEAA